MSDDAYSQKADDLFKKEVSATRFFNGAILSIFLFSLWIKAIFPIYAIGWATHDDLLFIRLATSIGSGHWLGNYDNLTHAKGIAYPVFIFLNHLTGLPLKLTEHALYLWSALFFSSIIGTLYSKRYITIVTFLLLSFPPFIWSPVAARVTREGLYVSLSLFLIALAIRCFVVSKHYSVAEELHDKKLYLILLGTVAGIYWLTREEGIWLLPSILIIISFWLWSRRHILRPWRMSLLFILTALIPALLVVETVNSINYFKYGVFRNNDFRSSDFQAAYGSLARIKQDHWQRYVIFPKDARERAYRFSAAARELAPSLEGAQGNDWRNIGCDSTGITPCPEILSGWFMWALRDAVAAAGHYSSAQEAQAFYRRLAAEIDVGCSREPTECLPNRETMLPPWRQEYLLDTTLASWKIFNALISMGGDDVGLAHSVGNAQSLAQFALITNGPLASTGAELKSVAAFKSHDVIRLTLAEFLAKTEEKIAFYGIPAALALWLIWVLISISRRKLDVGLIIVSSLVAAVGTRVILLGFLEATSIPSNNILYLSPVMPIALALVPTVFFGIMRNPSPSISFATSNR